MVFKLLNSTLCILLVALTKISQMRTQWNFALVCDWVEDVEFWSWKARLIRQPAFTMQVLLSICEHSKVMNCLIQRSHVESMFLYCLFMSSQLLWHWNTVVKFLDDLCKGHDYQHTQTPSLIFLSGKTAVTQALNLGEIFLWIMQVLKTALTGYHACLIFMAWQWKTVYKNCQPLVGCNR